MSGNGPRVARRNVAVLFIDLSGWTELAERLDPELLQQILERYHVTCTAGIREHGGVVEKYIGDAVMAVFGTPVSHEDDALRAVRAAHAALSGVHALSAEISPTHGVRLDAHAGVAFGEVMVVEGAGADLRVVGDTVNTASRLQSRAEAGEILLSDDVATLARGHVVAESVRPLALKGKKALVPAWRLIFIHDDPAVQDSDAIPFIGRTDELRQLAQVYERVVRERQCCMVTVHGIPGIGKTRLVREFLGERRENVTVLVGRCPSYGVGITYRPIVEMLETLNGDWTAIAGGLGPTAEVLRGLAGSGADAGIEEIAQAVRDLFEILARRQPLIVVLDNLHWAEPTLFDLVEECTMWLVDVPVLFVCVARPELFEERPTWGGGQACAMSLELRRLDPPHMARLVAELSAARAEVLAHDADTRCDEVAAASDGNPLFAELLLEALIDDRGREALPPTIQALLGSRLDRLGEAERDVLERAATIGQVFTVDQLDALRDDDGGARMSEQLRQLTRRRVIRRGALPGAFEFAETLTRESVYAMTRKELRAGWHLRLADWYRDRLAASDRSPFQGPAWGDVTHHLQTACILMREVRPHDPLLAEVTDRASDALVRDGGHALYRKDLPAAIALLQRGQELLPAGRDEHRSVALRISDAELARGDAARARSALRRAADLLADDVRHRLTLAIQTEFIDVRSGERSPELESLQRQLAPDPGDDLNWCRFGQLDALVRTEGGRFGDAEAALREALRRARALGDRYEEHRILGGLCELVQWSPTPVRDGLQLCDELLARFAIDRALLVPVLATKARLLALAGDLPSARAALEAAGDYADELHLDLSAIAVTQVRGLLESLDGDHDAARAQFAAAARASRASGHATAAATLDLYAARESLRMGDPRAARALSGMAAPRQLRGELTAIMVRARLAALDGAHGAATDAAGRAETLLDTTDDPCLRGEILFEIAQIRHIIGRDPADAARRAREAYAGKGAVLPAERVRTWMGAPRP